jgi:hypothetical protein
MKPPTYDRAELEQRILASFDAIDLDKENGGWINDKSYQDFSNAWLDLLRYYEQTQDPVMSIAVLDTYLMQTEFLRAIFDRAEIDLERRGKVKRALMSLEIKMMKIRQSVIDYNPEDD